MGEQAAMPQTEEQPPAAKSLTEFLVDEDCLGDAWSCQPSPWMRLEIALSTAGLPKPHFAMRAAEQSRGTVRP